MYFFILLKVCNNSDNSDIDVKRADLDGSKIVASSNLEEIDLNEMDRSKHVTSLLAESSASISQIETNRSKEDINSKYNLFNASNKISNSDSVILNLDNEADNVKILPNEHRKSWFFFANLRPF